MKKYLKISLQRKIQSRLKDWVGSKPTKDDITKCKGRKCLGRRSGFLRRRLSEIGMRYIGVGETADDLLEFNAKEFVDAIFE